MNGDKRIIPFEPEHVIGLGTLSVDEIVPALRLASQFYRRGPAFTAVIGDRVIACAGMACQDGAGEVWMIGTTEIERYPIWLTKNMRGYLADVKKMLSLHRIQAIIKTSDKRSLRFIEWLGFTREGTLVNFGGPGVSCEMYRLKEEICPF